MQAGNKLFAFFGLIATGKSTVAQAWAARHNMAYHNSDVVRKELAGLGPQTSQQESFDQGIYSKEFSEKTYEALLERATADLGRGRSVILDASYQSRRHRVRVLELAQRLGVRVYFVLCTCPEDEMKRRMAIRAQDPNAVSDGRWEVYLQQKERFEAPEELTSGQLLTLTTDASLETMLDKLDTLVED